MDRGLFAALLVAQGAFACDSVLGIDELTVVATTDAASASPTPGSSPRSPGTAKDAAADSEVQDDAGPPRKRVFVTSNMSTGIMGGRDGADALCAAAAATGKLSGTWIAWLSQGGEPVPHAVDRIPHDGPFHRLDDVIIAQNKEQLKSGSLLAPIITTETGEILMSPSRENARVWTGTVSNGTFAADCNKWSTSSSVVFGTMGSLTYITNGIWTNNGGPGPGFANWGCQTRGRLYCFEL